MNKKLAGAWLGLEATAFTVLQGSMVTLGLLVAPILFKSIESRDLAGRVFGNILSAWFWVGLVCVVLLNIGAGAWLANVRPLSRILLARLIVLLGMTGLIVAFGWVMSRIQTIQNSLTKPIEQYDASVNPRLEFDQLHRLSTNLLTVALGLGLVWLVLSIVALVKLWGNRDSRAVSIVNTENRAVVEV